MKHTLPGSKRWEEQKHLATRTKAGHTLAVRDEHNLGDVIEMLKQSYLKNR